MVSVFFFLHKFAAASFETTGPEAIQSEREKEGGEERKSERTEGTISRLSKQPFSHPEGLCPSLAQESEMPHKTMALYLSLLQASDGQRLLGTLEICGSV